MKKISAWAVSDCQQDMYRTGTVDELGVIEEKVQ